MPEYIEREAVIHLIERVRDKNAENYDMAFALNWAAESIKRIPAADVRPVVLCLNCKYAPSGTGGGENQGFALEWPHDKWPEDNPCPCKCADGWYSHKPKPDFFCAAGEKGEEAYETT